MLQKEDVISVLKVKIRIFKIIILRGENMDKKELDYIIDCHVMNWKQGNGISVNLMGFSWDEKEYIMQNINEQIRKQNMAIRTVL